MLAGRTKAGPVCAANGILQPFALARRIPGEDNESLAREILENNLVASVEFSFVRVAQRRNDGGKWSVSRFRHVQVSRRIELRLAFEDQLFDAVGIVFDHTRSFHVGRRLFERTADQLPDFLSYEGSPFARLLPRLSFRQLRFPPSTRRVDHGGQIRRKIVPVIAYDRRVCRGRLSGAQRYG